MSTKPVAQPLLIQTSAIVLGMLLALAVHILGVRIGLNLGGLWYTGNAGLMPASVAAAWWLVAAVGLVSGYVTAALMGGAASSRIPPRLRQLLFIVAVGILAAAGPAASGIGGAGSLTTASGVIAGLTALGLGALMAFCGAIFALRNNG